MKNDVFIFLCGIILVLSCQPPAPQDLSLSDEDKAVIDSICQAGPANWNEGGVEAYATNYYTSDAVFLPPNAPAISGIHNIIEFLGNFPEVDISFESVEIDGTGGIAFQHGKYTMTVQDENGNPMEVDRGKFLEIWKKQDDGSWLVSHDIFNSDMPVPDDDDEDDDEMDDDD